MKDKPIMFSREMIRALLDGRKTQTRRIFKLPPNSMWYEELGGEKEGWFCSTVNNAWNHVSEMGAPYGQPGDLLWVRENFQPLFANKVGAVNADYKTGQGYAPSYPATDGIVEYYDEYKEESTDRVRPSIHMPRWASRLTLKITDVRVERLQDISEEDAQAEGIIDSMYDGPIPEPWESGPTYRDIFADLWDSLYDVRGYGWDVNPWVWVVSFEIYKTNIDNYRAAQHVCNLELTD